MPARLRDIARALRKLGFKVEEPSKGSHWKVIAADGTTFTIPAHNGAKTAISEIYIASLCRTFGIDVNAFRKAL